MFSIKVWLKKSGTYDYNYDNGHEIIDELPFERFFRHPDYPWFWLYEESLFKRISDTFEVFTGTHFGLRARKGLLDVFIFPIISRRLLHSFMYWENWNKLPPAARTSLVPFFILPFFYPFIFVLEATRFTLAGFFTLLSFPIISIVHGLTYFTRKNYLKEIRHLQLIPHPDSIALAPCELGAMAAMDIAYASGQGFRLYDKKTGTKVYIIELKMENLEGIAALLATNAFSVLDEISSEKLHEIQNWLSRVSAQKHAVETTLESHLDTIPISIILTYAELASRKQSGQVKASFEAAPRKEDSVPLLKEESMLALETNSQIFPP